MESTANSRAPHVGLESRSVPFAFGRMASQSHHPVDGDQGRFEEAGSLRVALREAVRERRSLPDVLTALARVVATQSDCVGLWMAALPQAAEPDAPAPPVVFRPLIDREEQGLWPTIEAEVQSQLTAMLPSEDTLSFEISGLKSAVGVISVVGRPPWQSFALAGCFSIRNQMATRHVWLMTLVSNALESWFQDRQEESLQSHAQGLRQLLQAMLAIGKCNCPESLAIAIANQCKPILNAEQVYWGSRARESGRFVLRSISDIEAFDRHGELGVAAQAVMNGVQNPETPAVYAVDEASTPREVRGFLERTQSRACLCLAVDTGDDGRGMLLFTFHEGGIDSVALQRKGQEFRGWLEPQLRLVHESQQDLFRATRRRIHSWISVPWTRKLLIALAVVGLILACPWPYRIACDVQLEPVSRRFVSAPFEALLERTLVKSGDRVTAGEILATLDGQSLRFELAGLEAELATAGKKRDQALASRDIAEAQIQKSEMLRIQSLIDENRRRLGELEIRCPIDGVVVSGDLDEAEGAKLQLGQNLFEIGPLEEMLVEVRIPETQIRHVQAGDSVVVKFNAFPFQTWDGTLQKIHPRSEVIDGHNVFVAEVKVPNHDARLQPGMQGRAKIAGGWSVLGWVWFHRAWNDLRYWFVW